MKDLDVTKVANNLTLQEYVLFREINGNGNISQAGINLLKGVQVIALKSLIRKRLMIKSTMFAGVVHPHPDAGMVMNHCRNVLGINKL